MNGPPWGSEVNERSSGFNSNTGEVRNGHVPKRSSLLLVKLRMGQNILSAKDLKPPPRPKRISSAKPDTVNRPEYTEEINGGRNSDEAQVSSSGLIAIPEHMGSSSSINKQQTSSSGARTEGTCDPLTLSHAPARNVEDTNIDLKNCSSIGLWTQKSEQSDKDNIMVQRSPVKHYKHLTFKGTSVPVIGAPQHSIERTSQPLLSSLFPQKGKYEFNSGFRETEPMSSDPNLMKPFTIRSGSTKLHHSDSMDPQLTSPSSVPVMSLSDSAQKTALTYGTLRKSNASSSVSELFQKSKTKVRNSFKNLKLYARNAATEDKSAADPTPSPLAQQHQELYDANLPKPDDMDGFALNWLSVSASTSFHRKQAAAKAVLPVKIPKLSQPLIGQLSTAGSLEGSEELGKEQSSFLQGGSAEPLRLNLRYDSKEQLSQDGAKEQQTFCKSTLMQRQKEINHVLSKNFHDVVTDDDVISTKTPEEESIEILDSVIESHSQSHFATTYLFLSVDCKQPQDGTGDFESEMSPQRSETPSQNLSSEIQYLPSTGEPLDCTEFHSHTWKHNAPNLNLFLPPPPTCDPNCIYSSVESLPMQSTKLTPVLSHSSPIVTRGMSVPDILAQGSKLQTGTETASTIDRPCGFTQSLNSQTSLNYELHSFDDSSISVTESQDFVISDVGDTEEVTTNNAVIRKTGWLTLKHFLVSKQRKLEKSTKRKWIKYWVSLKGSHLLFHEISECLTPDELAPPVLIVPTEGSLVQAMPEHATKSNVLFMSTMHGSVYLFQAASQTEVESWIQCIHNEAALSFAQQKSGGSGAMIRKFIRSSLLQEVDRMQQEIEEDEKMRKMAELQNSLVSDSKSHRAISEQILKWEENAERNHVHVFRLHCYLASLDASGQPHPQSAIAASCKSSKQILSALKCFNIGTLHSLVVAKQMYSSSPRKRSFNLNLKRSGSFCEAAKEHAVMDRSPGSMSGPMKPKKSSLFGSLRGFDTRRGSTTSAGKKKIHQRPSVTGILTAFTSSSSSQSSVKNNVEKLKTPTSGRKNNATWSIVPPPYGDCDSSLNSNDQSLGTPSEDGFLDEFESIKGSLDSLLLAPPDAWCMPVEYESSSIRVATATDQFVTVTLTENMTFHQILEIVCQRKQLNSNNHYIVVGGDVVSDTDLVSSVKGRSVEVKKKKQYTIELEKIGNSFGFSLCHPKILCCPLVIESLAVGGVAEQCGLKSGEEIMVANGELTAEMNDADVKKVLSSDHLRLLIQTTHYDPESSSKMWWFESVGRTEEAAQVNLLTSEDREKARIRHLMAIMEEYLQRVVVPPPRIVSKWQPPFIHSQFLTSLRKPNLSKRHGSIEDIISMLTVPSPASLLGSEFNIDESVEHIQDMKGEKECDMMITRLLKKAELVTKMCQQFRNCSVSSLLLGNGQSEINNMSDVRYHLSNAEKMWKVLEELVNTEANYVKDLDCLLKRFLEPLHAEGFLTSLEMESLLQSAENILSFQQIFFADLFESSPCGWNYFNLSALNRILLSVTSVFLRHASQFKLYAVFATCHTAAQELVEQTKSASSDVRTFLEARNPKLQHSLSLDSYLIKPIQRVLKYPLLLRELLTLSKALDVVDTKARRGLKAALHAMHAVARHINDSQTVHDEFGNIGFREAMEQAAVRSFGSDEITPSLSLANLLCYCTTEWQNAPESVLSRIKKGNVLEMLVLVFRSAVVLLCQPMKPREKKRVGIQSELPCNRSSTRDFTHSDVILGLTISVFGKFPGEKNVFELSHNLEVGFRSYRLECNSFESKQRLVKTVRYVMKDCRRAACDDTSSPQMRADTSDLVPSETAGNEEKNSSCESSTEIVPGSPVSTKAKKQNFFYLPDEEPERVCPEPSCGDLSNTIPMTLPLPTYEVAVQNITQSTNDIVQSTNSAGVVTRRSASSSSARSKSTNRRSGLFIATSPLSQNYSDFTTLLRNSRPTVDNYESFHKDFAKSSELENHLGDAESSNPDNFHGNHISINFNHDASHSIRRGNPSRKYPKSPSRYNMVYGVAPYEGKL